MASAGSSWQARPDKGAQRPGVGVLIDTEYLASDVEERRQNPYYIIIERVRYYGPTPEKVVEMAREHPDVKGSVRGEAVFVQGAMKAPEQTALPANRGRTMKNRAAAGWQSMKNKAAAAAASVKGTFQSKPAASGAAASGAATSGAAPAASAAQPPPAKMPEARFAGQNKPDEEGRLQNGMNQKEINTRSLRTSGGSRSRSSRRRSSSRKRR
jgi:hypothetical protein